MTGNRRGPKKTEVIEIRIDATTKTRLQLRAEAEQTTISDVVRRLIANFLTPEKSKHWSAIRTGSLLAGALTVAGVGLMLPRLAYASPAKIELHGVVSQTHNDVRSRNAFRTTISPEAEEWVAIDLGRSANNEVLSVLVQLKPAEDDRHLLTLSFRQGTGNDTIVLSEPRLLIADDQPAYFVVANGGPVSFDVEATKLTHRIDASN